MHKVLLVDDDESIARSVTRTLDSFEVTCEPDPVRLLLRLQAGETYDAIILDQQMPTMNGTQLYGQIAKRFPQAASRVVFMTGTSDEKELQRLRAFGRPLLSKPYSVETLRGLIGTLAAG
ncbi:MAG TPA: response regulator [Myxococcales bacterium]|jgi:CheY-like chemotaxis protein|nr:response regulator [Myxococcales bacterium]